SVKKSALEVLVESPYSQLAAPPRFEGTEGEVVLQWLEWALRRRNGGGDWREWISEYGHERPLALEHQQTATNELANEIIMRGRATAEQLLAQSFVPGLQRQPNPVPFCAGGH
ncbi:hypothetical protein FOZ61_005040, partial [Perkinsus olseni]